MSVTVTVRQESSGYVSVDYAKGPTDVVCMVDYRELETADSPLDILRTLSRVRQHKADLPWRSAIINELTVLLERCRQRLADRRRDDGPTDLPHAG